MKNRMRSLSPVLLTFPLLLCFLTSCATWHPEAPEGVWKDSAELHPGIRMVTFGRTEPRLMQIRIVRIDTSNPRLGFYTTPKPAEWGQPMPEEDCKGLKIVTRRQTCKNFMLQARKPKEEGGAGLDMVLAFNASPWTPWKAPWNHKFADRMGLVIAQGDILDQNDYNRPCFIVLKNGEIGFRTKDNPIDPKDIYISAPGFAEILAKGEIMPNAANDKTVHPRTGFGISQDKRYFYVITIEGRQKEFSIGATTGEVAQILKEYGADSALNMDGGGSTTLMVWKDEKAQILTPQKSSYLRSNGNNVGVYFK